MMYRSLTIAAMSAIGSTALATCSFRIVLAQEKATQPVSVYVAALQGECVPDRTFVTINGQVLVGPPKPSNAMGSGKMVLTRFTEDPDSRHLAEDEFKKNKAFRVVDSPAQAHIVFCLCTKYNQTRIPPQMQQQMRQMSGPEEVRIGTQVAAVSVENYLKTPREPKALAEIAFWKGDDRTTETPDEQKGKTEKEQKRLEKMYGGKLRLSPGYQSEVLPYELVKRFIKRWPAFETMIVAQSKSQTIASTANETSRPKLTTAVSVASASETAAKVETLPADPSALRIETTLVIVPVMAMDKDGKYLPGLAAADFEVYEDGIKQEISDFGGAETPIHVALVLDVSGSTRFKLEDIQDAALDFVEQLRPQDRVMVVSFDQEVRVDAEFTNERKKLMRAILRTRTGGGTRVQDALDLTLTERLDKIQGRKAVVVFTDGVDTSSRLASWQDVTERVEESGVVVYPVRYNTQADVTSLFIASPATPNAKNDGRNRIVKEYEQAAQRLKNLSAVSGGRYYEVGTIGDTNQAFANIAEELRRHYWLGYYPADTARDGKYHKIRVVVGKPEAIIRARQGYRAPGIGKGQTR